MSALCQSKLQGKISAYYMRQKKKMLSHVSNMTIVFQPYNKARKFLQTFGHNCFVLSEPEPFGNQMTEAKVFLKIYYRIIMLQYNGTIMLTECLQLLLEMLSNYPEIVA
jgi:hypothetical protein